ncbi:MAG TPA: cell division protein FtsK [Bacteroidales bacterium]|nr:cell division protein FtsK [Bacteroidales bacterium]HCB62931.1 cell division protein FtsK [Bacteroidales bacterium]HCY24305.1 cell division protein FtsK [Bacteroidales bacterium]
MKKSSKENSLSNTRKEPKNSARNTIKEIHRNKNNNKKETPPKNKAKSETTKKKSSAEGKSFLDFFKSKETHFAFGLFLLIFSIFLLFSFISYLKNWHSDDNVVQSGLGMLFDSGVTVENSMGKMGAWLGFVFIKEWFGIGSFLLLIFFINSGLLLLRVKLINFFESVLYLLGTTLWLSVFMSAIFIRPDAMIWGGLFGWQIRDWISGAIGNFGLIVLLLVVFVIYIAALFGIKLHEIRLRKNSTVESSDAIQTANINSTISDIHESDVDEFADDEMTVIEKNSAEIIIETENKEITDFEIIEKVTVYNDGDENNENNGIDLTVPDMIKKQDEKKGDDVQFVIETNPAELTPALNDEPEHFGLDTQYDPLKDLSQYVMPPTSLMIDRGEGESKVGREELESNKNRIVQTLNNYDIKISQIKATIGPTVTMYEIVPAPGVRISRIKNLEDDIALSLAALGIRIIAPIPGKGTIGIEVPNITRETVSLRSLLESEKFIGSKMELPFAMGKTITNEPFVADLAKLPHLLIAGATGQGKSVGLNAIICSLLYKKHPSQLKFVFVDPKKVELALYAKIEKHFLAKLPDSDDAIITDVTKVIATLTSLTQLMDSRYDLLKNAGCKNIIEYNHKFLERRLNPNDGHMYMPYIVLVIDEFADLIMTAGKEVELPVARIAQLARAVGIHLIVATQRPSVDVITGKIKANFPARIAFKVSSKVDSRTILDMNGADQLIGMGDMLYCHGSTNLRLQCAFVDTPEIEALTDFIGDQQGYPVTYELPEPIVEKDSIKGDADLKNKDKLFEDAAHIVVALQQGSTSLLQTKLTIGFARARRIIEQLEQAGIVGPPQGSKPRDVLVKDTQVLEQFLKNSE